VPFTGVGCRPAPLQDLLMHEYGGKTKVLPLKGAYFFYLKKSNKKPRDPKNSLWHSRHNLAFWNAFSLVCISPVLFSGFMARKKTFSRLRQFWIT